MFLGLFLLCLVKFSLSDNFNFNSSLFDSLDGQSDESDQSEAYDMVDMHSLASRRVALNEQLLLKMKTGPNTHFSWNDVKVINWPESVYFLNHEEWSSGDLDLLEGNIDKIEFQKAVYVDPKLDEYPSEATEKMKNQIVYERLKETLAMLLGHQINRICWKKLELVNFPPISTKRQTNWRASDRCKVLKSLPHLQASLKEALLTRTSIPNASSNDALKFRKQALWSALMKKLIQCSWLSNTRTFWDHVDFINWPSSVLFIRHYAWSKEDIEVLEQHIDNIQLVPKDFEEPQFEHYSRNTESSKKNLILYTHLGNIIKSQVGRTSDRIQWSWLEFTNFIALSSSKYSEWTVSDRYKIIEFLPNLRARFKSCKRNENASNDASSEADATADSRTGALFKALLTLNGLEDDDLNGFSYSQTSSEFGVTAEDLRVFLPNDDQNSSCGSEQENTVDVDHCSKNIQDILHILRTNSMDIKTKANYCRSILQNIYNRDVGYSDHICWNSFELVGCPSIHKYSCNWTNTDCQNIIENVEKLKFVFKARQSGSSAQKRKFEY